MSDLIRQARAAYGPELDRMTQEAGKIKQEYVACGGDPSHVYSPERMEEFERGGADALSASAPMTRDDGSIAGPYVPTEMALANNLVEERAVPAVLAGLLNGVETVSSGVDQASGAGFAIGRAPDGRVVRLDA
jgi:hypothetical protein